MADIQNVTDVTSKEKPIRSVERAIKVLQVINKNGAMTMTQISKELGLPYPTTCRFVFSLIRSGVVERERTRKYYRPTALVQSLSCGYQPRVRLVTIARPHIVELTRRTGWPVSLASRIGSTMVIQDSTHTLTTLTFSEYFPGHTVPILGSASGLAYLAYMDDNERAEQLEQIRHSGNVDLEELERFERNQDTIIRLIREDGYTSSIRNQHTKDPGKTSSIAVPLFQNGTFVAALTMIFFSSSLRVTEAIDKHREDLVAAQIGINHDLDAQKLFKPENLTF